MALNQSELQSLRHIIGGHDMICEKLQTYAQQAIDPQVRQYFEKSAKDAQNTKQRLMSFLQ